MILLTSACLGDAQGSANRPARNVTLTDRPTQLLVTSPYSEMETDTGRLATSSTSPLTNSAYTALEETLHNLDVRDNHNNSLSRLSRLLSSGLAQIADRFSAHLTIRACMTLGGGGRKGGGGGSGGGGAAGAGARERLDRSACRIFDRMKRRRST